MHVLLVEHEVQFGVAVWILRSEWPMLDAGMLCALSGPVLDRLSRCSDALRRVRLEELIFAVCLF